MEETGAIGETPMMAEVGAAVIGSPTGSGTSGFKPLGVGINATEIPESGSNVNETFESGTNGSETLECGGKPTETLQDDSNTNETLESGSNTNETLDSGTDPKETLEGSSDGIETLEGGTKTNETPKSYAHATETVEKSTNATETVNNVTDTTETLGSGTSEIETFGVITPNEETLGDIATTEPSESANHFDPAVVLDCTGPRFDLVEDKDLDPETRQDNSGNMAETESPHEKTSPLPLRRVTDHQIESVNGNNTITTSRDPTENSAQEGLSAGCSPVFSTLEMVSTSAFASEHQKNEENDAAARVKFEPRKKCSDVLQAVEILKTSYKLSDVTIRKNMMTWSCWNIADVIRGPHKETTWWKGRSLPRGMDAKADEFKEIIADELPNDEEFHQEMAELCRKIDTRDRELVQILDEILQVAQQNNVDSNTAQTDPNAVLENQTTKTHGAASLTQSAKGQGQQTTPDNDNNSAEALDKHRNPFARMMRAIRRRFSRRNRTRKN